MSKWILQFDGGASPNPGRASCAYRAIRADGKDGGNVSRAWCMSGTHSNNEAEWEAAVTGLAELLEKHPEAEHIIVMGDSELVVNQANEYYRVTKAHLRPYFKRLQDLRKDHPEKRIAFKHVRREFNEAMDEACKAVRFN